MATRKSPREPQAGPESPMTNTDHPLDTSAFAVEDAEDVKVTRGKLAGPNPLEGKVRYSFETAGPQRIAVHSVEHGKMALSYLRKDAEESNLGVRILWLDGNGQRVENVEGASYLWFKGKQRSKRSYTIDDIRSWARDNGLPEWTGRVPAEVRDAFKTAHKVTSDA